MFGLAWQCTDHVRGDSDSARCRSGLRSARQRRHSREQNFTGLSLRGLGSCCFHKSPFSLFFRLSRDCSRENGPHALLCLVDFSIAQSAGEVFIAVVISLTMFIPKM